MNDFQAVLTPQQLEADHPGWTVELAGQMWEAITRPTPTSLHVLIGRDLSELAARLARAEAKPAE